MGSFKGIYKDMQNRTRPVPYPPMCFLSMESHVEGVGMVVDKGRCTAWSNTMLKALKRES